MKSLGFRQFWSRFNVALSGAATAAAGAVLVIIVAYVLKLGAPALSWDFFTHLPTPVGVPGGGVGNAIVGSAFIVGLASAFSVPIGVLAGIYLALYGRGRLAYTVRFVADVLTGVPSIAIGVFAYALIVRPTHSFSALSASIALAIIMLPIIVRTTEESMRLVPGMIREGALALGLPEWKATMMVTVPVAMPGIITGGLLAVARVAGESAPLLFTAFGTNLWGTQLLKPISALPLVVFTYAGQPYKELNQIAWGCAFVLIVAVLGLNVLARVVFRRSGAQR